MFKRILMPLLPFMLFLSCNGQQPTGSFGQKISESGAISIDQLMSKLKSSKSEISSIKVTGKIYSVCKKKGCWMSLQEIGRAHV